MASLSIATVTDPHVVWSMLESSYCFTQSSISSRHQCRTHFGKVGWLVPDYRSLRPLEGAGLAITDLQFYSHFFNPLPADYDTVIHDPRTRIFG
jgi:hypothetical protein